MLAFFVVLLLSLSKDCQGPVEIGFNLIEARILRILTKEIPIIRSDLIIRVFCLMFFCKQFEECHFSTRPGNRTPSSDS